MSLFSKGDEPPIEEILAWIRQLIAEHPIPRANHVEHALSLAHEATQDDGFELPAMFRAPRQSLSVRVGAARGAPPTEPRTGSQSDGPASKTTEHVSGPAEVCHEFGQDRTELRPSTLTAARRNGLAEKAPEPVIDALQQAHWSLSMLGSGVAEEDAPARRGGGSSAPDRPAMPMRAPAREEAGDQVPSLTHANPATGEASAQFDIAALQARIDQDRAASPPSTDASAGATGPEPVASAPDASEQGVEAPPTASRSLPALGPGASEARAPSQIEDGTLARDDMSFAPELSATEPNTDSIPRHMISIRATLVVCVGQTQVDTEVDAGAHKPLLPERSAASRSYGPMIPVELGLAEVPAPSAERHGAWAGSLDKVGTVAPLSAGSRTREGDHVTSRPAGSLDETAIAVLGPLLRQWLDSHIPPLLVNAIRAEMDSAQNRDE